MTKSKAQKIESEKRLHASIENLDLGDGIYFATGDSNPSKGGTRYKFFYSNEIPALKTKNNPAGIEITFSSIEPEDNELLRNLFQKTR